MTGTATHEVITGERALELLRQVVAEAGENVVYRKPEAVDACVYAYDGCASCMVGHALLAAGARIEDLEQLGDSSIHGVARVGSLWLENEAAVVFDAAQVLQDEGKPWGVALRAASYALDLVQDALLTGGAA